MAKEHHYIAREGWSILAVIGVLAIVSQLYVGIIPAIFFGLLLVLGLYIFRNPARLICSTPLAVVSPASGEIKSISKVHDQWLSRTAIKIQLKLSVWDVHNLCSPAEGKVMNEWSADCDEPGFNRRYTYWLQTDEGDDIVASLLLGKKSPFVKMLLRTGERVGQGQPCGFLYYVGKVEIYLPENAKIDAEVGTHFCSGTDILGQFVHNEGVTVLGK